MYKEKIKKDKSEVFEEMENVTVVYADDIEEHFQIIRVTGKGIIIGRLIENEFVPSGFIPKHSIKKIRNDCVRSIWD